MTVNPISEQDLSTMQTVNEQSDTTQADIEQTKLAIVQLTNPIYLPQPWQAPIQSASFKQSPEDFQVSEIMDVELSGEGEHLWLHIQKTGMNTVYVADHLAKWANIPKRDVGYSGMKDRQAVTTQWFSLRIPKKQLPATLFADYMSANGSNNEALTVIDTNWHTKKLNRGTHRANRFVITLREIVINDTLGADDIVNTECTVDKVLTHMSTHGVPNYFGLQRFGHDGNNIMQALEWFDTGMINGRKPHPKKSRDLQSILLSAARSAIFNQIVAKRVQDNTWNKGIAGDVFNLDGSGSVFTSETIDETINERLASGDIHPTAPLWGIANDKVTGEAKALEESVVYQNDLLKALALGLEKKGMKTMRRAMRLPITDFHWEWNAPDELVLDFTLPTGTFATSVLASLVKELSS